MKCAKKEFPDVVDIKTEENSSEATAKTMEENIVSIEQKLATLEEKIRDEGRIIKGFFSALDKKIVSSITDMRKKMDAQLFQIKKMVDGHKVFIKEVTKKVSEADETLCNVLLAIRQNEYLQTWYPAQKGFPEMKVVGSHIASCRKAEREESEITPSQ